MFRKIRIRYLNHINSHIKIHIMKYLWLVIALQLLLYSCQLSPKEQQANDVPFMQEQHRPRFHFTPLEGWMNDPNGMVYYDGEYHLHYQHYPDASVWGPMHWGHAVSKDLMNWEHLPISLYPDELGMIFSGSTVVDKNNTSGFKTGEYDPLVAIYTYHNMTGEKAGDIDFQTQGIAYSNDKGRTWTKYENNPVLKNPGVRDFRDPKVFWHETSQQWVMIISRANRVQLYNSPNLKDWTLGSEFGEFEGGHGGVWECPDLFELPVDGNANNKKWVMLVSLGSGAPNGGSGTQYFVGDFDGKTFKNENSANRLLWIDYGKDNYAGVTFSDIPAQDGRRLFIGWMSNWQYATKVPTQRWRSAMTLPRVLSLKSTRYGTRLITTPAKEIETLRSEPQTITAITLDGIKELDSADATALELQVTFDLTASDCKSLGVELYNDVNESFKIRYDHSSNLFIADRSNAGNSSFSPDFAGLHFAPRTKIENESTLQLHLFVDNSSIEVFADGGATIITDIFFPSKPFDSVRLFSSDGKAQVTAGQYYTLKNAGIHQ